ncbi:YfiR family protein [Saccharicrinis sp. 156]|uniref:YfiR family protein n=1 Tax=Saccharicrinis sp. 156 TaxID=3417574 RepID=UPI003D34043A
MKKKLIAMMMILMSLSLSGQQSMFKALFMFNFAKYIEWPNQESQKEFIIGVYGDDEIIAELNKLAAARKINNKSIVVANVSSPSEAGNANIFYVPSAKSGEIGKITSFFAGKSTLIITDNTNLCNKGAGINYTMQGGKMKFEICKRNITSHHLNIDPKLVTLGIEIK